MAEIFGSYLNDLSFSNSVKRGESTFEHTLKKS